MLEQILGWTKTEICSCSKSIRTVLFFYPDNDGGTADLILQFDGIGKTKFMQRIIDHAISRQNNAKKPYKIVRHPILGNGLVASRNIQEGEIIQKLQEQAHYLVTKDYVEKSWTEKNKEFFAHFAYPLSDNLYVMWDPDPHNWVPINHSCDPNVWVTGLNMTARRPILSGESITFDYATMYTSNPVNFKCLCGTSLCRGMWQGNDYLQQWFKERYGTHVTDFVQHEQKRHPNITSDSSQERSL